MNLYRVKLSNYAASLFVVAEEEGRACRMAEEQWRAWGYDTKDIAIQCNLVAQGTQYPVDAYWDRGEKIGYFVMGERT